MRHRDLVKAPKIAVDEPNNRLSNCIGARASATLAVLGETMAKTIDRKELLRLARLGAEARLDALERERKGILRSFPGIRRESGTRSAANNQPVRRRRRRPMSAAERKAVSARMKKYWAGRRKEKGK
jgi:hypothetical protein